jgi:hypothetical protein
MAWLALHQQRRNENGESNLENNGSQHGEMAQHQRNGNAKIIMA